MKQLLLFAIAILIICSACTEKCLRCECSNWLGCENPYDTTGKTTLSDVSFCDGEDGIDDDNFDEIEEEMTDENWKCTNS